jgi:CheY-like chemotaxis protein
VEVAADGLEALARLQDKKFHLILMDIHMPNMDGLEATRKIRLLEGLAAERMKYASLGGGTAKIPIIGLTASASKEDEQNCYEAGMDGFLTKPINKEKFVETLNCYRPKRIV